MTNPPTIPPDNTPTITTEKTLPTIWPEEQIIRKYARKPSGKLKSGYSNILLRLRHAEAYNLRFQYNALLRKNMIINPTTWETKHPFEPRPLTPDDITYLKASLERDGLSLSRADLVVCVNAVCKENTFGVIHDSDEVLASLAIECLRQNPHFSTVGIMEHLGIRDRPHKMTNRLWLLRVLKTAGYECRQYIIGKRWEMASTPYHDPVMDGPRTITTTFTETKTD